MSDSVASALSGALGGMASMALTYPLITLSTRSQVSKTERLSQWATFLRILKDEGAPGLYS
jgi:adenine nucleotide transporter 17